MLLFLLGENIAADQIAFRFNTNAQIDAGRLAQFLSALASEIENFPEFPPNTHLTVRRIEADSPMVIVTQIIPMMADLSAIGAFVFMATQMFGNEPDRPLAKRLAEIMEDDSVVNLEVLYRTPSGEPAELTFAREEVAAVRWLRHERGEGLKEARAKQAELKRKQFPVYLDIEPERYAGRFRRAGASLRFFLTEDVSYHCADRNGDPLTDPVDIENPMGLLAQRVTDGSDVVMRIHEYAPNWLSDWASQEQSAPLVTIGGYYRAEPIPGRVNFISFAGTAFSTVRQGLPESDYGMMLILEGRFWRDRSLKPKIDPIRVDLARRYFQTQEHERQSFLDDHIL